MSLNLPRVSHILDVIDWGYKDVPKFILDKSAKYGTGFHQLVHKKASGQRTRVSKKYKTRHEALEKWLTDNGYKIDASEIRLTWLETDRQGSLTGRGYQGTCDAVLVKAGLFIITDWKTGRVSRRHFLQLAAYKKAYEAQTKTRIDKCVVVRITKDGQIEEYDPLKPIEHYEKVFMKLLRKWYKKYGTV